MTKTKEYFAWASMWSRCTNKNHASWADYGARGISVCERWKEFSVFLADVGKKPRGHSLDRMDNNGDYEPGNVRWATSAQQQRNKRTSRVLEHGGRSMHLNDWAKEMGVNKNTLYSRLRKGWAVADALKPAWAKQTGGSGDSPEMQDA